MPYKPTIIAMILAALSVASMAYFIRLDTLQVASGDIPALGTSLVALRDLPVDDVDRITLTRGEDPRLVFERREGHWLQVEPFEYPMELFSIQQFAQQAGTFASPGAARSVEMSDPDQDGALGFDPPRAIIRYQWGEQELTLELGRLVGAGRAYVRLAGDDQVYSVEQHLHQRAIQMDVREWRSRRLFHDVSVDADAIEMVVDGAEGMTLRRVEGRWKMFQPVETRVNTMALESWLRGMDGAKIADFRVDQPDDLSQFGLDRPVASLVLTTTSRVRIDDEIYPRQETQRLLVGAKMGGSTNDRFAMIEPWPVVFRLTGETQGRLFPMPSNMTAPTASGVAPSDVKAVTIQTDDAELRLVRELDQWRAPEFSNVIINAKFVNDLLAQLFRLQPKKIELAEFPRELQIATVILIGYDRKPIDAVRIARDEQDNWILENGDDVLRFFPSSLNLPLLAEDFGLVTPPKD